MWDPYAEFESAVLPNGLVVHVACWPDRPWVAASVLVHSGARQDKPELEGTAHFVEHLCSRNAPIPYQEIKDFFDNLGGGVRLGATGWNFTFYDFFAPVSHLGKALEIFGSMLITAKLDSFVEAQRQVILGEYQRSNKLRIETEMKWRGRRSLYHDNWFCRSLSPLGSPESIERIAQADLQAFHDTHYTPTNMSVVMVGGINLKGVVELIRNSPFGATKPGTRSQNLLPASDFPAPKENRFLLEFSKYVNLEKQLEAGHYDSVAVLPGTVNEKAVRIVGSMLYQLLFEELRERRGWTYAVGTEDVNMLEFRQFSISASAISLSSIDTIEKVVDGCVAMIEEREDLMRKKIAQRINSFSMSDITGKKLCQNARVDLQEDGRIISLSEEIARYKALTMDDIRSVVRWLRPERRRTVLTVP